MLYELPPADAVLHQQAEKGEGRGCERVSVFGLVLKKNVCGMVYMYNLFFLLGDLIDRIIIGALI